MDYYLQRRGILFTRVTAFLVLPHLPIFFWKSATLRSVASAVSLEHVEYSKSPFFLSEGFLVPFTLPFVAVEMLLYEQLFPWSFFS
jgi:hypothetical protein